MYVYMTTQALKTLSKAGYILLQVYTDSWDTASILYNRTVVIEMVLPGGGGSNDF